MVGAPAGKAGLGQKPLTRFTTIGQAHVARSGAANARILRGTSAVGARLARINHNAFGLLQVTAAIVMGSSGQIVARIVGPLLLPFLGERRQIGVGPVREDDPQRDEQVAGGPARVRQALAAQP